MTASPSYLSPSRPTLRWAALASGALHAIVLTLALLTVTPRQKETADMTPMVELMLVTQKGQGQTAGGAPPAPDTAARTPPRPPAVPVPPTPPPVREATQIPEPPATPLPVPPPPPPSAEGELLPPSQPPAPPWPPDVSSRPAASAPAPPPVPPSVVSLPTPAPPAPRTDEAPQVNLGGTNSLSNVLAQGDAFIPAGPDSKVHNREPIYPNDAAARGEHGLVVLLIHVTPDGLAGAVDILHSSGYKQLDEAARDAVRTWKFVPAVRDGQPVNSALPIRINFELN